MKLTEESARAAQSANLVQRLQTIGPLLAGHPAGIVHQLDLSKFNEPVHIVAPS